MKWPFVVRLRDFINFSKKAYRQQFVRKLEAARSLKASIDENLGAGGVKDKSHRDRNQDSWLYDHIMEMLWSQPGPSNIQIDSAIYEDCDVE